VNRPKKIAYDFEAFEPNEVPVDWGEEVCPVCKCHSVEEAIVVSGLFEWAALHTDKSKPFKTGLVCKGGCTRDQKHK
jgi:hypothetical protein